MSTTQQAQQVQNPEQLESEGGLLSPRYRTTTAGILIVVTLIAFEAMAVATAMPTAVKALHGLAYYGWAFTGFLITNVVGIVTGGEISDRDGPRRPLLAGLSVFTAGLFIAGLAPNMASFIAGRAVQGFGSGLIIVAIYVVIAESYGESLRPKMFAAFSAAWVLPSLVGPVISGALAQHVSWRAVFLMIPPFVLLGLTLILPAVRRRADRATSTAPIKRWRIALVAAVGVATIQYAGQALRWWSVPLAAAGVLLLAVALRQLFPAGTLRVRRGLPSVVAFRGISAGAFFAVDSYVPLTLTELHGYGPTVAGVPLILGSIGWSVASWWQGRHADVPRHRYIRAGFVFVMIAAWTMALLTVTGMPGWLAFVAWLIGGAGMGSVMPSLSILMLDLSPEAERGRNSSAMQIADVITSAICVGLGGVMVAAAERTALSLGVAIRSIDLAMGCFAILGVVLAARVALRAAR
ncbi:MAG TPA: MFS transporter [Mycobacteriales bacterium]|nr:MFS transporter [Mycobacteriales bacterium]